MELNWLPAKPGSYPNMGKVVLTIGSHTEPITAFIVNGFWEPEWLLYESYEVIEGVEYWARIPLPDGYKSKGV